MKNKILQMVVFCIAVSVLIFLPAIFTLSSEIYLNVTMSKTGKLPTLNTYEKLEKLVKEVRKNYYIGMPVLEKNVVFESSFSSDLAMTGSSDFNTAIDSTIQSSSNYSSTNVQVQGVDEADILKNDGKYIYTISNDKLVIVEAFPANKLKKISEITIEKGYRAIELYLSGDKLFLITDNLENYKYSIEVKTKVLVFDIKDRTSPNEIKTFEVTGTYTSSRMIGEKVYVFTNLSVYGTEIGDYIVPKYRENSVSNFQQVLLSDIQYVPNDEYTSYTQILAFDLGTPLNSPKMVTYLGAGANNIYMSQKNLYMAQNKYNDTIIYKFNLEKVYPTYEAKGKVPGYIVNQFAMDEYDGNFRIATTKNNINSVYILGPSMHKLGSVTNIVPGETIKSVRFEGTRGYVVTFRNTDPLFVMDLSKVRAPEVLGELKIPGYSTYLHTYDENHIIGFGYDGTEWGTNGKLKIALFDITDVENPIEKFIEKIDASDSDLLTNHKSLLFSKEKNLIAFSVGDYYWKKGNSNKVGKVYTITTENGFELRGEIEHIVDVNRMLFMDDILYGVSEVSVSAHDINSVELLKEIEL